MNAYIAPELTEFAVPIAELHTHPENARRGDMPAIAESLNRFGQLRPILALPDGTIVAGNHTYRAASELLEWSHVAALRVKLSVDEARAYLLADNRTAERGTMDPELLVALLEKVVDAGDLRGTGYTEDDVNEIALELSTLDEEMEFQAPTNEHAEGGNPAVGADATRETMEQILLLYDPTTAARVRADCEKLKALWGMVGVRDVMAEAVQRAVANEGQTQAPEPAPVEG